MTPPEWLNFYHDFFPDLASATEFVDRCEAQRPPDTTAKLIMHQTQRLATLGDELRAGHPDGDALAVLFLLVTAENVSKLHAKFDGEGQSRHHVRRFFTEFSSEPDQTILAKGVRDAGDRPVGLAKTVDLLYGVRCDVVHEGRFWEFTLMKPDLPIVHAVNGSHFAIHLTLIDLRAVTIRTSIHAAEQALRPEFANRGAKA